MSMREQLVELMVAISPLLIVLVVNMRPPKAIGSWVGAVLASASLAVLAIGFSMMRFTRTCATAQPSCQDGQTVVPWNPGLIEPGVRRPCALCIPGDPDTVTAIMIQLNACIPAISTVSAALCVILSGLMLIRFARWSKAHYRRPQE
jgi:hypothetical protein